MAYISKIQLPDNPEVIHNIQDAAAIHTTDEATPEEIQALFPELNTTAE